MQGHCEVQFSKWQEAQKYTATTKGKKQFAEYLKLFLKSTYVPTLQINVFRKF
jgi:hypothetical protein